MTLMEVIVALECAPFRVIENHTPLTDVVRKLDFRKHKKKWTDYIVNELYPNADRDNGPFLDIYIRKREKYDEL